MIKKIYTLDFSYFHKFLMVFIFSVLYFQVFPQNVKQRRPARARTDSTIVGIPNPAYADSAVVPLQSHKIISQNAITSVVKYSARDSVVNDLQNRYTYLFGDAMVQYDDMELRADYIEIDFVHNELYACGVADSNGNMHGFPVFSQAEASYNAREFMYNFNTQKGKITNVITTQDDGFIHGEQVKKIGDNVAYIKRGKYTTCELGDPHYEITFSKAKVI